MTFMSCHGTNILAFCIRKNRVDHPVLAHAIKQVCLYVQVLKDMLERVYQQERRRRTVGMETDLTRPDTETAQVIVHTPERAQPRDRDHPAPH